ncbi:C40 family peptidase [Mesorhizobium sp. M0955]|uniref:C40 family peptidase n=1 Tax=Mesorhizobium sp. M0955 TaxID=2957033 RepID=UPI00333DE246
MKQFQLAVTYASAFEAAKQHAREQFPKESCGVIVKGAYIPLENIAPDPLTHFEVDSAAYLTVTSGKTVNCLVHSHPDGPFYPSALDMQTQMAMQVPWAIIAVDEGRVGEPVVWGDPLPPAPIIGREFMHGVHDCMSLIRDHFRLGREELAQQDIAWPHDPIPFADCPRDDAWWDTDKDLYSDNFAKWGFRIVSDPQPGDVFLCTVGKTPKLNHGGVLLGNGLICHHLPLRLSRREPAGLWGRQAKLWMRHHAA